MPSLSADTRAKFETVSTATITTVLFKRGLRNVYLHGPQRLRPGPNMVGEAYTLRYIPAREDLDVLDVFKDRENPQRKAVEECPEGAVFVVDSRGDASAASCGGILATRLQARGCKGLVTDGGFRDSHEIAELDMPSYHLRPSPPTNLTQHHAVAINDAIACGGVAVFPGDIMVGDAEGVVCVPRHLADEVAAEAFEMTVFEDFVVEKVAAGASTFGLYPPTDSETEVEFSAWRKKAGR
ncbi:ribonuclease activity regulator RraA [Oceanomicrobium pacificus]|uniref:Ribonuclease activity regulator RraA n=1 Tax=Oceanomicrobium pacificus TaxID=2692916 RepID=A0A6B0TKX3_9RHOB|nr:ribonuclease activity regulator RraA [Oceanomicrobium pacificus]MXU65170.1 ribonuclease activity regulator RraA [Oceanomicrobium pacificus]